MGRRTWKWRLNFAMRWEAWLPLMSMHRTCAAADLRSHLSPVISNIPVTAAQLTMGHRRFAIVNWIQYTVRRNDFLIMLMYVCTVTFCHLKHFCCCSPQLTVSYVFYNIVIGQWCNGTPHWLLVNQWQCHNSLVLSMDSSTGINYQIKHKNLVMIVKTVFLCDLKLAESVTSQYPCFCNFNHYFGESRHLSHRKTVFPMIT